MSAPATLEPTPCPLCGASAGDLLVETPDLLYPGPERFRMLSCRVCGHLYQSPRPGPEQIARYYPAEYLSFQPAIADIPSPLRRLELRRYYAARRRMVERSVGRGGRILDVGCATGNFLDTMRRAGWHAQGVEPSPEAAAYARERLGLDVITGRLEEAGLPGVAFDAVTFWDVLEHVHQPQATLAEAARILRPGGILVLGLPNPDSLEARLLGRHWIGWDLPRHLNLFRPPLLRAQLARMGMPVERINSPMHGYAVLVMSLEQRARALGRDPVLLGRLLRTPLPRLLAALYYRGPACWYNLSSTMVVVARRTERPEDRELDTGTLDNS
ncbi:MAG: class I SAM-dependent methyltransferase [Chloroflexi bacterium OHK40]